MRLGQIHTLREQVERRAKRSHHRCDFARTASHFVGDGDRVVLVQHLPELLARGPRAASIGSAPRLGGEHALGAAGWAQCTGRPTQSCA